MYALQSLISLIIVGKIAVGMFPAQRKQLQYKLIVTRNNFLSLYLPSFIETDGIGNLIESMMRFADSAKYQRQAAW